MDQSKFSGLLIFFVANYFFSFLIIGVVAGVLSLINKSKPLRADVVAEALFSYYLLFTIGINNLVNFIFHVFAGDLAAEFIGWANSPFQAEVGFASLGVGIAGVIAFKKQACRFDLQRLYRLLLSDGEQPRGTFIR
jgi:uncharacterized protein DUF6790